MARPRKDAPPRTELILDAATKLLLRDGFGVTSVEAIAKEAGVSKATYYIHYEDKEAVLEAVIRRVIRNAPVATSGADMADLEPRLALERFANDVLASLQSVQSIGLFRLIISEAKRSPEMGQIIYREMAAVAAASLAGYLKQQAENGSLDIADPSLAAFQFLGLIKEPLFWPKLFGLKKAPFRSSHFSVVDQAVELFMRGYGVRGEM